MEKTHKQDDFWGEPIYTYTAEQAVEDGILVDVSEMAREAGFSGAFTIRISVGVHNLCTPPKSNKIQSYDGRLWDVLYLAGMAVGRSKDLHMAEYQVKVGRKNVTLWAMLDTTSGPAIHIIIPSEY